MKHTNNMIRAAKLLVLIILPVLLLISLAACGIVGDILPASEPKSDPVPEHIHNWVDATHQKPKTCSGCGQTEGEPLSHEWREANYQESRICTECGEIEGEPIPPKFPALGFEFSEIGVTYPYKSCYEDLSDVTGKATVKDVRVTDGDDYYEPKEDCEWVIATCAVETAENPKVFQIGIERTDFYCYGSDTKFPVRTVNYRGTDREIENKTKILQNTSTILEFEIGYLVPVGYDGVILLFLMTTTT